jgi:hypothetical protein
MKKYLLTIFGDFKSEATYNEVATLLTPLVDSPTLKFQINNSAFICYFGSEMDMEEMHEFLELLSYDLYDSFILSEYTDKVSVFMSEDDKKHLFGLDKDDENDDQYLNYTEDEFVALLLNEVKMKIKSPTLDQLLDKIKNSGMESLTPFEKGTLEKYSKN